MRIAIFGATGKTGRELVGQALAQGHQIVCLSRDPATAKLPAEVALMQGDAREADAVAKTIAGSDAVFSAIGARSLSEGDLLDRAVANILAAMKKNGVRRLIVLGAAGAVPGGMEGQSWASRLGLKIASRTLLKHPFQDQAAQERRLRSSEVNYTIVRPPRLTNAARTGRYRVEPDHLPRAAKSTPRADVAEFMLKQLSDERFVRRGVYIAR